MQELIQINSAGGGTVLVLPLITDVDDAVVNVRQLFAHIQQRLLDVLIVSGAVGVFKLRDMLSAAEESALFQLIVTGSGLFTRINEGDAVLERRTDSFAELAGLDEVLEELESVGFRVHEEEAFLLLHRLHTQHKILLIRLDHVEKILLHMLGDFFLAVVADTGSVGSYILVRNAYEKRGKMLVYERLIVLLVQTGKLVC